MSTWKIRDARVRLSELIAKAGTDGPQTITRRGVDVAVVVPYSAWMQLTAATKASLMPNRPSLKEILLSRTALFGDIDKFIPPRGKLRRRKPIDFE